MLVRKDTDEGVFVTRREMADEGAGEVNVVETEAMEHAPPAPSVKPLPFNSKRLKTVHLKRIAAAMSSPTSGSADEVRQMVERRLTEMDKEPRHVQVLVLQTDEGGIRIQLMDVDGPFLDIKPEEEPTDQERVTDGESSSRGDDGQDLESALQESRELTAQLREEVSAFKAQLEKERLKVKEIWRKSCDQLREFDETLVSKEEEVESLRG